jgi:hypothetical protein
MPTLFFLISMLFTDKPQQGQFKIYGFEEEIALSPYEYDETWLHFLNTKNLKKASFVLTDKDIEFYHWKKQEIKLSKMGYEKLKKWENKSGYLYRKKFIVSLNNERIYAGEFLSFMSAMAIVHPVIHDNFNDIATTHTIRIYPVHTIGNLEEIPTDLLERTATPKIKRYFEDLEKLR